MKVAVYKKAGERLRVEDAPLPIPGAGQALIKVCRCGICATDLFMTAGHAVSYAPNTVIGHEIAGEVLEIGPDVDHLKVGDHVAAFAVQRGCGRCPACLEGVPHWCTGGGDLGNYGGFAQVSMVREIFALKLPRTVAMADGALIEPLACSLHGVNLARLDPDARVLVIGAGAIGLGTMFWARRGGAGRIVAMARSDRHRALAMQMGADAFISGDREDTTHAVQSALQGAPDVVFECSGATGMIAEAINQVRPRGTIVELGFCCVPDTFVPAAGLGKEITLRFSMMYNMNDFRGVADALDRGELNARALVTDTISLDQLPDALEGLRQPHNQCKVLVDPWL
jgi:threonine dehydrogenase-like Zn-dependent dehydrogenase